jgi:hypothetical protein
MLTGRILHHRHKYSSPRVLASAHLAPFPHRRHRISTPATVVLHSGHVPCFRSHSARQYTWKLCPQGVLALGLS